MKRILALAILFVAALAHADALPPPPTDCPTGGRGAPPSSHRGGMCVPARCRRTAECPVGFHAMASLLRHRSDTRAKNGRGPRPSGGVLRPYHTC